MPEIYNYFLQYYSELSKLVDSANELSSAVGCQQGGLLAPAIFNLPIYPVIQNLQ